MASDRDPPDRVVNTQTGGEPFAADTTLETFGWQKSESAIEIAGGGSYNTSLHGYLPPRWTSTPHITGVFYVTIQSWGGSGTDDTGLTVTYSDPRDPDPYPLDSISGTRAYRPVMLSDDMIGTEQLAGRSGDERYYIKMPHGGDPSPNFVNNTSNAITLDYRAWGAYYGDNLGFDAERQ